MSKQFEVVQAAATHATAFGKSDALVGINGGWEWREEGRERGGVNRGAPRLFPPFGTLRSFGKGDVLASPSP